MSVELEARLKRSPDLQAAPTNRSFIARVGQGPFGQEQDYWKRLNFI